ncbi:MAG: 16S rRNA (cytosine(1402)-N(4))-methyltransferase RsmH [Clostridia bacterium]|nr:16S rRNA (cytosine(1402)-N(4))-methyltransferase RsmH [Clostridia bacterium]
MAFSHVPVLLQQTIEALRIDPQGVYVDCTAGGGGHSAAILDRLQTGMLVDVDRDPQAIEALRARFAGRGNVRILHGNFFDLPTLLSGAGIDGADGILADLGVSSHQLDTAERGFSFHQDAPLDMRMSMQGISAADVVNTYPKAQLQRILYAYGEEKYAPAIAAAIVRTRERAPIETTLQLAQLVKSAVPAAARRDGHPARRTFQAIRIEVNGELERLDEAVQTLFGVLRPGGRLCIITFHSLEDRIVKKRFAALCTGCTCPPDFPVCVCGKTAQGRLPMKAVTADETELEDNNRSRSAKLRVIEKIG